MALNKNSYTSDAIVNIYRAALYLARGLKKVGLDFLIKSKKKLGKNFNPDLNYLIKNSDKLLKSKKDLLFWAEKVLNQYHKLRYNSQKCCRHSEIWD
jgi:hypothetical protein